MALKGLDVFFISVTCPDEMYNLLEPYVAVWDTSEGGEERKKQIKKSKPLECYFIFKNLESLSPQHEH